MKTATVADLRNHFRRVASWVESGETVKIVRRGKVFAHLVAEIEGGSESPRKKPKLDVMAQLHEIWGNRVFTMEEVEAMRASELEGEEG